MNKQIVQIRVNWSPTNDGGYADVFTVGDFFDSKLFHSSSLTGKIVQEIQVYTTDKEYALITMIDGTVVKQYNINGIVYGKPGTESESS
jgi:hypothetical protein